MSNDPDRMQNHGKITSFNLIDVRGNIVGVDSTAFGQPGPIHGFQFSTWQINNLNGSKFTDNKGLFASEYAFAGQKIRSASTDYLRHSRDATFISNGGSSYGSTFAAGALGFVGSIGSTFGRIGNGILQLGANVIDTKMIELNTYTMHLGMRWQYDAIGTLGQAVERGEVSTGDIAYGVGVGLGTMFLDTATLGGFAAGQYYNGAITAEEAGDRFIGVGLSALGGVGALRAAGLGNATVGQAAAAVGRTAASTARTVAGTARAAGTYAANAVQRLRSALQAPKGRSVVFSEGNSQIRLGQFSDDVLDSVTPVPGFQDVFKHHNSLAGAPQLAETLGQRLAVQIVGSPAYQGGPVRLIVCWAGEEVGGIAPIVARELGQEVLAATKPVWTLAPGTHQVFMAQTKKISSITLDSSRVITSDIHRVGSQPIPVWPPTGQFKRF